MTTSVQTNAQIDAIAGVAQTADSDDCKPRVGQPITYRGGAVGTVTRVEGNLCWRTYPDGESLPFIWRFKDGLNSLHDWPTKSAAAAAKAA